MRADERYERFVKCLSSLKDDNATTPILVEGLRDERALRHLGLTGDILVFNAGRRIDEVAHGLAAAHRRIIVLFDWDRTGGHLVRRLTEHLHAQVQLDLDYRKELAQVSQVRSVEDLPAALRLVRQ